VAYRLLDHTADVGLEVEAAELPELFSDAIRGMTDVITEVGSVEPRVERYIEATADGLDLLLLEFLGECLYRFDAHQELFRDARVEVEEAGEGWSVRGVARGEGLDPRRHPMKVMIKAVTYHQLQVERADDGWRARVILDI
jgi:SHS2 domain-containing protein